MFDFLKKEHSALQEYIGRWIKNDFIFRIGCCKIYFSLLYLLFTFFGNATNYYVSSSLGNDSNPGTESAPWATLSKVNASSFSPGDKILFKRGDTFYGSLTIPNSGASGNPITFGTYGTGNKPVITANTIATGWTSESATLFYKGGYTANPNVVIRDGVLQNNNTVKANLAKGEWWYDATNDRVYIYGDPSADVVEISASNYCLNIINKDFVTIDNLHLEGGSIAVVKIDGADNLTITNSTIKHGYYGIHGLDCGDNGNISNTTIEHVHAMGVLVSGTAGTGWNISYNEIRYCGVKKSPEPYGSGIYLSNVATSILRNKVYENGRLVEAGACHGIYVGGAHASYIIRYNNIYNNYNNGIKVSYSSSNTEIAYNLIHGNQVGIVLENLANNTKIYNNTIYANNDDGVLGWWGFGIRIASGSTGTVIKNNIVANNFNGSDGRYQIYAPSTTIASSNNNIVYTKKGGDLFNINSEFMNWSEWQSGHDPNGFNADPLFVNPNSDLSLTASSPAINAGADIGLMEDFAGNPIVGLPDIGAYEYQYNTTVRTKENISICEGSSYKGWTTTGHYERVLIAASGADSIVTTNLTVNPVYHVSEDVTILEGESYLGWSESGQFERTLTALSGCDSIITTNIKMKPLQKQSIYLNEGWNIFSSFLIPSHLNMENVLEYLIVHNKLIEVQDENGKTFLEDINGWNNNIGALQQTEGYKIKVNSSSILQIEGYSKALPLNIELKKGWNIISFPYDGSVDAMKVIQPLIDSGTLEKVQDERGNSIEYWGMSIGWINRIGNFISGEGYLVQVNNDVVLPILEIYEKSSFVSEIELENQYFKVDYNGNGFSHMNINITGLIEANLQIGDEIAAFDGNVCVGATILNKTDIKNNIVSIHTSAKDENDNNGFKEGNAIELRFWDADAKEEVIYLTKTIEGDIIYKRQESVFIQLIKKKIELNDLNMLDFDMYPNPATDKINLIFSVLPEKGISIFFSNMNGKIIMERKVQTHVKNLNIHTLPSGIYLVKIVSEDIFKTKKLIIIR